MLERSDTEISSERAVEIARNEDWMYGGVVALKLSDVLPGELNDDEILVSESDFFDIQMEALLALAESRDHFMVAEVAEEPIGGHRVFFRLSKNFVVKIGPAVRDGIFHILAVIVAVFSSSNMSTPLFLASVGIPIRELFKHILSCWEKIEDPIEQLVFETVFRLAGKYTVVNYDALKIGEFERAYGQISPTAQDIYHELSASLTFDEIKQALRSLKTREILREKNGRWNIRL